MSSRIKNGRVGELDFFRGIALLMMVYFHVVFDMKDIFGYDVVYSSGVNYYVGKASAITFMFISGISCYMSRSNFKRGLRVLAVAMIITVATHMYGQGLGVKFGILHFLGISMLMAPILKKINPYMLIAAGVAAIVAGNHLNNLAAPNDLFFIFGYISSQFSSSDYYPLLPWIGVFLFGLAAGDLLYREKRSLFSYDLGKNPVSMVGRRTLIIYIVHQPLIIAVLTILSRLRS